MTGQQREAMNSLLSMLGQEGGGFSQAAQYYQDLLQPGSEAAEAFAAPEMRRYQEEILPGLAERFAGMGSGGVLGGSSFQKSALREGSNLAERLAAIRAGTQQQGAAGLTGLGQLAAQPQFQPVLQQGTPGIFGGLAMGAGQGIGSALGNPGGQYLSSLFKNSSQGI